LPAYGVAQPRNLLKVCHSRKKSRVGLYPPQVDCPTNFALPNTADLVGGVFSPRFHRGVQARGLLLFFTHWRGNLNYFHATLATDPKERESIPLGQCFTYKVRMRPGPIKEFSIFLYCVKHHAPCIIEAQSSMWKK